MKQTLIAFAFLSSFAFAEPDHHKFGAEMRAKHEACLKKHNVTDAQLTEIKACGEAMREKHMKDERPKDQADAMSRAEKHKAEFEACLSGKLKDGYNDGLKTALQECRPPHPPRPPGH